MPGAKKPVAAVPGNDTSNLKLESIFSEDDISTRLDALADEISKSGLERMLIISVLTGSFVFAADLIRALYKVGVAPEVDFIALSSYRTSKVSSGTVEILRDVMLDVCGRNVLLVDDVLDSGRTLAFAKDLLAARGAKTIKTCVLLEKTVPRAVNISADFRAFECPDLFVVGYGMDVSYRLRELPFVGRVIEDA